VRGGGGERLDGGMGRGAITLRFLFKGLFVRSSDSYIGN
jgi:hypothetical protein